MNFLENKPNVAGFRPTWLFDIDTLTMSMNYQLVVAGNQPNDNAGIKENLDAGKVGKETISAQQYVLLPLWSIGSQDPQNTDDDVVDAAFDVKENENDVYVFANGSDMTDNKKHDENANRYDKGKNTNRVNAVSAPVNAVGPNLTNITNSFNTASPSINVVNPNFGIAGKSSFVDPSKYPNDPDMHELEDIVYSDEEEDMDVKSAFLYVTIEEEELCKAFERLMKDKFQMISMGELTFFLGLQLNQKDDEIFISQDKYVAEILRKFGFTDVKSASTPIETEKPLLKDPDDEDMDVHIYRFQVTPKVLHLHAVKRIFRYLKGKPHLGLWYPRDSPFNLVAYFDSDYARASLDRKFTTGGCQFL
nr:hypothetical protein [Tanacetum cinerariifolium]